MAPRNGQNDLVGSHFDAFSHFFWPFWASGASRLNPARFFGTICIRRCSERLHGDPIGAIFGNPGNLGDPGDPGYFRKFGNLGNPAHPGHPGNLDDDF